MIPMYSYPGPGAMRRALRRILTPLVCGAFLLAGCSKDLADEPGRVPADPEPPAAESGTLNLSISVSGVSSARPGTYALTPEQEAIVDMAQFNVLLFRAEKKAATDDKFEFVRYAPAKERGDAAGGNNGVYQRHFAIELPQERPGEDLKFYKVMVVANYSAAGADDAAKSKYWEALLGGKTLSDARGVIRFAQEDGQIWNTAAGATPLPLWGETQTAFTTQVVRVATIHLLRAVARIDVGVNLGGKIMDKQNQFTGRYDLTSNAYKGNTMDIAGHSFEIEAVTLHNAAREGFLAPDPQKLNRTGDGLSVLGPTIDNKLAKHDKILTYSKEGDAAGNMLRSQIYLPESPNKTDDNREAFYIVVKGKYNNGPSTYYRVDFYDRAGKGAGTEHEDYVKPSATNRYDILRNHAYVINILRVRGAGYPTEEDAAASEPMNMEVDVYTWDTGDGSMGNIVTDGQYRLALSSKQLRYHQDGTAQDIEVMTDFLLEGNPAASGWKLLMLKEQNAGNNAYNHADDVTVSVEQADGTWTAAKKTEYAADTKYWLWTTGAANVTGRVRIGMTRFADNNTSGLMERTVRLLFTAGRMSQAVELVQDVKNTRTLSLLQQKLFFPKYPASNQSAILKSSPAGATYYIVWTGKDGNVHRANLSTPEADDANTITGREGYIGGIGKATADILPAGFDCMQEHAGDASCQAIEFLVKGGEHMFALRPSAWDATHHGGAEPTAPRTWRFEIEAYWDDADAGAWDDAPERVKLDVEQSNYEVRWYPARDQASQDTPLADNTYTVPWDATAAAPYIMTTPTDLPWYFVSKSDAGNLSGREWVTNWAAELQGQPRTGEGTVNVTLTQNENLLPRTVTMQASSAADGFDKGSATLKIKQEGGPFVLTLHPGVGVAELPYDRGSKTYTLDFGTSAARVMRSLNVRANSDWWWEWRKEGANDMGDKTANTSDYLDKYPEPIHIHNTHPYWQNEATPQKDNPGYVINEWLPDGSTVREPGIDNGTNENGDENSANRLWENALYMRNVTGVYLAPNATSDENITQNRTMPVAGRYYSEIQLYNKHDYMKGNTDEAAYNQKVAEASKVLRVQRTVPSLLYLAKLPFRGNSGVNLSNFTTEELGVTAGDASLWDQQRITIRSNNKVTVTLYDCEGMDEKNLTQCGRTEYKPTQYEQVLDITLAELKRTNGGKFIIAADVPYDDKKPTHTYKIKIEGWRQAAKDGADEAFTQEFIYRSGYWINHPATVQVRHGAKLSNAGFDLLLDFTGSVYHKDQHIRVGRQKVSVGSYNGGYTQNTAPQGTAEYKEYKLDGSQYQCYVRHTVPANTEKEWMYIYWVEYKSKTTGKWLTTWSGGAQGTKPENGKYLFLQEAVSYGGLVTLQNGPVVPKAPDRRMTPGNYDKNFILWWYNYDDNPASIRFQPHIAPKYAEYCKSFTCGVTGEVFAITSIENKKANEQGFNSQWTIDAYRNAWGKTGHVFLKIRTWWEGKHWFFGSREHTRFGWDESDDNSIYNVRCPDNHGDFNARPTMQKFTAIEVYYRTLLSDSERGPLNLIVVRKAVTGKAERLPSYNAELQGTEVTAR